MVSRWVHNCQILYPRVLKGQVEVSTGLKCSVLSHVSQARGVIFAPKVGQIGPSYDKIRTFSDLKKSRIFPISGLSGPL